VAFESLSRAAEEENQRDRDRLIGVYIGILAVILAICSMGGGNAGKEATLKTVAATNTWSFFQAKNMRRHVLRMQADELEILKANQPDLPEAAKAAIDAKIASYKAQDAELTSDEKSGEGLDQLWEKGKALEVERDLALKRDPYFDYGEALLQIAIVLASIAIISGGTSLLAVSGGLGLAGALLTLNGFTLAVHIPFIG
jgi:hypothetical protein